MKRTVHQLLLTSGLLTATLLAQTPISGTPEYDQLKKQGLLPQLTQRVEKTGFYRPVEELPVNWDLFEPKPGEEWEEGEWDPETGKFYKTAGTCFQSMSGSTSAAGAVGCDDCSEGPVALGFNISICGTNYNQLYINSNGNVTFGNGFTTYTPVGMPNSTTEVMVAPFWADVDTRSCGTIRYKAVGGTRFMVRWNNVGYYDSWCDLQNHFQLILTDGTDPVITVGNNIAFDYEDMQWTTGDASGGSGGFGGSPACVGINANDGINATVIGYFDNSGASYDGPGGANDGVNYLDNKCFQFNASTLSGCTPLPVAMPIFTGRLSGLEMVALEWTTTSEIRNKGFVIQRSVDGQHFDQIGYVNGAGDSEIERQYSFSDHDATSGTTFYYRLKQESEDGSYTLSNVIEVNVPAFNGDEIGNFYPNPAGNDARIQIYSNMEGAVTMAFFNVLGQEIRMIQSPVSIGLNNLDADLRGLTPGLYTVRIRTANGNSATQSLVIQ